MQYAASGSIVQGICPIGWHIPNAIEFNNLKVAVNNNGNSLKALLQGSGNEVGTDESGFSALLAGYRGQLGTFYQIGNYTNLWSSMESDSVNVSIMWL